MTKSVHLNMYINILNTYKFYIKSLCIKATQTRFWVAQTKICMQMWVVQSKTPKIVWKLAQTKSLSIRLICSTCENFYYHIDMHMKMHRFYFAQMVESSNVRVISASSNLSYYYFWNAVLQNATFEILTEFSKPSLMQWEKSDNTEPGKYL